MFNEEDPCGAAEHYTVYKFSDVIEAGSKNPVELPSIDPQTPYTLCYTSGTTGDPKGAIITHEGMLACTAALAASTLDFNDKDRHISYLPLAHIYERAIYNTVSF